MEMAIDPPAPVTPSANNNGAGGGGGGEGEAQRDNRKRGTPMTEVMKLELQLLRVPVEHLKKSLRASHRAAEKDLSAVLADINSVTTASAASAAAPPPVASLTSLVCRLHGIKRKLEESGRAEAAQMQRCRARIDHMEEFEPQCQCNSSSCILLVVVWHTLAIYIWAPYPFLLLPNVYMIYDIYAAPDRLQCCSSPKYKTRLLNELNFPTILLESFHFQTHLNVCLQRPVVAKTKTENRVV